MFQDERMLLGPSKPDPGVQDPHGHLLQLSSSSPGEIRSLQVVAALLEKQPVAQAHPTGDHLRAILQDAKKGILVPSREGRGPEDQRREEKDQGIAHSDPP
jgi:hypothetical protein